MSPAGEPSPLVVVFDLDDTLYAERDYVRSGLRAAARWAVAEAGLPDLAGTLLAEFEAGRRGDLFDRALAAHGLGPDARLVGRLVAAYRGHRPDLALFADAREALARLPAEVPLALLTDGYHEVQRLKVEALGIAGRFRKLVFTDALGGRATWKPSRAGFEEIVRDLPARRHAYVADNLGKDFVAPNALGWLGIHISRPGAEYAATPAPEAGAPSHRIADLRDLAGVLEQAAGGP